MRQWSPLVALVLTGCAVLEKREPPYQVIVKPDEYVILAESQFTPLAKEVDATLAQLTPMQRKRLDAIYILSDETYWNAGRSAGSAAEVPNIHEIYMRGQQIWNHDFGREGVTMHEMGHVIHLSIIKEIEENDDPFLYADYWLIYQEIERKKDSFFQDQNVRSPLENIIFGTTLLAEKSQLFNLPLEEIPPSQRFEFEWAHANTQKKPEVMREKWLWADSKRGESREGYASPYATKNFMEDVAETFRIYKTKESTYYDCDPIIMKKIELLQKYGFFE